MNLAFDPHAVLAEIRNRARQPSTLPKVPTVGTCEVETLGTVGTVERPAAQEGGRTVGRVGTLEGGGASSAPDLDAFEERAAIREHEGGQDRDQAEAVAARELGYAGPDDLFSAASRRWLRLLEAEAARWASDPRGRKHIAAALAFTREGWAAKAAALGWDALALFGVHPSAPWRRHDCMGAAFARHPVAAVTRDGVIYRAADGAMLTRWRCHIADDARAVWEISP